MSAVYIASASANRAAACAVAEDARAHGHRVVSTWHNEAYDRRSEEALATAERRAIADRCLAEVRSADRVIVLGHGEMRGALYEAGYADALGLPVEWRGPSPTLFSERAEHHATFSERAEHHAT